MTAPLSPDAWTLPGRAPFAEHFANLKPGDNLKVFPIVPGDKIPLVADYFKAATSDPAQLEAWAAKWPNANIGHSPEDSGRFVLDVDPKNGGDKTLDTLQAEHGPLPETFTVATPSGGFHYYFKGSAPTSAGKIGPGLDIRGAGGYVVVPRSVLPNGSYSILIDVPPADPPDWLQEAVRKPKVEPKAAPADVELDAPASISQAIAHLRNSAPAIDGQGGDARTVLVAAQLRDLGISQDRAVELMDEHWNGRCEPPWEVGELELKVANAYRYARNEPGCYASTETPSEVFAKAVSALPPEIGEADFGPSGPPVAPGSGSPGATGRAKSSIILRDEAMWKARRPTEWLIENFLVNRRPSLTPDRRSTLTPLARC